VRLSEKMAGCNESVTSMLKIAVNSASESQTIKRRSDKPAIYIEFLLDF